MRYFHFSYCIQEVYGRLAYGDCQCNSNEFPSKVGKTTLLNIFILHHSIFNSNKTNVIMANKYAVAVEIMEKLKISYFELPEFLRHYVVTCTKDILALDNNSKIIAKSTSQNSLSGLDISILYIDSFDYIKQNLKKIISSMEPALIEKTIINSNNYPQMDFNGFKLVKITSSEAYNQEFKDSTIEKFGMDFWVREYEVL